jgi:nitroreductase
MVFKKIVMDRYATKKFDGRKIPEDKVNELFEIIRYSASSFNIQPWKVKVVTDQETKEKLKAASWGQEQVSSCSHLLIFCANSDVKSNIDLLEKTMIENGAKKEDIKGYVDMMRGFESQLSEEKRLVWAQKQCYVALGNAINGAKHLGFDSCPMEGFSPDEYSKILKLPKNIVPTVLCPIGYAADKQNHKLRFRKEDIFF